MPLSVQSRASYVVAGSCPVKKGKKRHGSSAKRLCKRTVNVPMPLSDTSAGHYRATARRLPYNKRITFTTLVSNAAGLRSLKPLVRSTTLHQPKSKHRKH